MFEIAFIVFAIVLAGCSWQSYNIGIQKGLSEGTIKALEILNDREKEIIKLRKLKHKPIKLEELSKKFKISRERVRQIEEKALQKLQNEILNIH